MVESSSALEIDGNLMRRLREDSGFSVRDLADRAQITPGYVSLLETGRRWNPSPMVVARIAAALGCSVASLRPSRAYHGQP